MALAFLALLQRLPPRQRAVLLLKDVMGWRAAEIAAALELSIGSVNSALHRARETMALRPCRAPAEDPGAGGVEAWVRCWEAHDLVGMVTMMRDDITFAMPPHATWFEGRDQVAGFLRSPIFAPRWSAGFRVLPTRANGAPAFAFYHREGEATARARCRSCTSWTTARPG